MPKRYKVVVSKEADSMLLRHTAFLANVSIPASRSFLSAFREAKSMLSQFPLSGAYENHPSLPPETYRKYLFYGRYKILYEVVQETVYVDAVLDCRQDF